MNQREIMEECCEKCSHRPNVCQGDWGGQGCERTDRAILEAKSKEEAMLKLLEVKNE